MSRTNITRQSAMGSDGDAYRYTKRYLRSLYGSDLVSNPFVTADMLDMETGVEMADQGQHDEPDGDMQAQYNSSADIVDCMKQAAAHWERNAFNRIRTQFFHDGKPTVNKIFHSF